MCLKQLFPQSFSAFQENRGFPVAGKPWRWGRMWGFQLRSHHCNHVTHEMQNWSLSSREPVCYQDVYSGLCRRNNWNVTGPLLMSSQLKDWPVVVRKRYVHEYQICSGNGKNCENMIRRPKLNWTQEPRVSLGWLQLGAELREAYVIN